jgi:hypothetical protein
MGLLDGLFDSEQGRMGLGLLAAGSARGDGAGFGQRLSEAVGSVDQWKKAKAQAEAQKQMQEFQAFQMQQARAQAQQEAAIRALSGKFSTPAQPEKQLAPLMGDSWMPDNFKSGIMPTGATTIPAKPASFDREGFGAALEGLDPIKGLAYQASIAKDNTPITLAAGASLIDKRTHKPIYTAPAKPEKDDAKITQYEYAKANGYKGTFEQFVTLGPTIMAAARLHTAKRKSMTLRRSAATNFQLHRASLLALR